jgi:hypothetical protein
MNADNFRVGVFDGNEDIGSALPDGDRLRHVCSPHFIDLVGDDRAIVWPRSWCVQRDAARHQFQRLVA